jgi:tape measure domain-containing protein
VAENVVGSVVGKVRFNIDKKSWDNLALFQSKLTSIKRQMTGMDKSIKVNAVVQQINKVANATVNAEKKVAKVKEDVAKKEKLKSFRQTGGLTSGHVGLWKQELQNRKNLEKQSMAEAKRQQSALANSNKRAGMSDRLAWLFPASSISNPANRGLLAQMLRDEDKASAKIQKEQEAAYNARRKEVMGRRSASLKSRAARDRAKDKQTAKANRNRTAFEASVENFMLIKEGQINQYATQRKLSHAERQEMMSRIGVAKDQALKSIDPTQAKAIESFRAQVNKVKNEMVTSDRVTRANAVSFKSLRNEIVQLTAAYTAFTVVQNIAQDGMALEGIRAAAKVFTGSDAGTAEHMEYLVEMTDRLGVNFMTAAKEFNKFSIAVGSKADQQTQRHIFEGLSEYATVLQVDQQQYERGIRSVVQMFSKEQVYAEELRGQLAEALPGSVAAMMRASGFTSEKDFFKAVEAGKIMASEVMPKFADELKKIARSNGALEATTKKTRAEMQRFFNQLTYAKDAIFQGGMDEGLSFMFGTFADTLESLKPLAKALGGIFKGTVSILTASLKLIITPLEIITQAVSHLFGMLAGDKASKWGEKIWAIVGAGGTLLLLATRFKFIQNLITGVNGGLLLMMRRLATIAAPLLAIEDMWAGFNGKDSYTLDAMNYGKSQRMGQSPAPEGFWGKVWSSQMQMLDVWVDVAFKDGSDELLAARVRNGNKGAISVTQTETSQ